MWEAKSMESIAFWAQVITAAGVLLSAVMLIPIIFSLKKANRYAAVFSSSDRFFTILQIVRTYVYAAEQLYGNGKGQEKFEYVKKALIDEGIISNDSGENDRVRALIEAAVRELKYLERD